MKTVRIILFSLWAVCTFQAYGQTITNGDGTPLTTRYCYEDNVFPIVGTPAGGVFSGCGITMSEGQWYFNPFAAAGGVTVFPYQCPITYTVNGTSVSRNMLVYKPVVISPPLQDSATCNGFFTLEAHTLYAGAYNYQWTPSEPLDDPDTSYTTGYTDVTRVFVLTAEDKTSGCIGRDTVIITRNPVPVVTVDPDTVTILSRETVPLKASGASKYLWLPSRWLSNDTIPDPVASPQAPIVYTVIGTNETGCIDTATAVVYINERMHVPNAFSPNGDGLNDVFRVENIGYQGVEAFQVFNRWGQLVYETLDATRGWDGTYRNQPADAGNYYYLIRLRLRDNTVKIYKGAVLLMR